ncbi:MAG: glycine cleavage system aminomethyltransferase GcvT [Anaerolineae bacterium]
MTQPLKRTRLYDWHAAHGARMVPFAGWEMPVQYPTGPLAEHQTTRRAAGLFDIDHMGQIAVTGPGAEAFLNRLLTWDVSRMGENEANYSLMCYDDGGVVDDVFVYRLPGRWLVVVNAANLAKDLAWLEAQAPGFDVSISDVSAETYMLALQGPKAIEILDSLAGVDLAGLARFTAVETQVNGVPTVIGRTGYTGEDGVELFFPDEAALSVWQAILAAGAPRGLKPIGLAARDSLRFEPGFPLYGHELDAEHTPLEARLGWAVKFNQDFIGRAALLKQKLEGPARLLAGFEMVERGLPRQGYPVAVEGQVVGQVVTGMLAPTVEKYAGNAYLPRELAAVGTEIDILIRNKPKKAVVVRRPLYKPAYR